MMHFCTPPFNTLALNITHMFKRSTASCPLAKMSDSMYSKVVNLLPFRLDEFGIDVVDWDDDRDGVSWMVTGMATPAWGVSFHDALVAFAHALPACNEKGTPFTSVKKFHISGGFQEDSISIFIRCSDMISIATQAAANHLSIYFSTTGFGMF